MTKLATILTVRSGSERYPNKCLAEVQGKPLLFWITERLSTLPGKLIVATTNNPEDDQIETICDLLGVTTFRYAGNVNDVDMYFHYISTCSRSSPVEFSTILFHAERE